MKAVLCVKTERTFGSGPGHRGREAGPNPSVPAGGQARPSEPLFNHLKNGSSLAPGVWREADLSSGWSGAGPRARHMGNPQDIMEGKSRARAAK